MKLRAKAKGNGIGGVVLAFFNYITRGSSISVKEKTAEVEMFFNEAPTELLKALTECEDFELEFKADNSEGLNKEETDEEEEREEENVAEKEEVKAEETAEKEEKAKEATEKEEVKAEEIVEREEVKIEKIAEGEETKATEEVTKREDQANSAVSTRTVEKPKATVSTELKTNYSVTDNQTVMCKKFYAVSKKRQLPTKEQCYEVEAVLKIANSSTSYEEFIEKTADFLEIEGDRKERFVELVTKVVAPYIMKEGKSITWSKIEAELEYSCKQPLKATDRIFYNGAVEKNIKVVGLASFINILGAYSKFYVFDAQKDSDLNSPNNKSHANIQVPTATSSAEESTPIDKKNTKTKFECMPSIPWFEKKLSELNSEESTELKVRKILMNMGLNSQKAENQLIILSIANAAVLLDKIDYNSILEKAKIKTEDAVVARMIFSKFINRFVNENGGTEKIKMIDFLEELKLIVNS